MTQIPYFNPSIPQDFRNRKGGLVAFGIVMIVIGALAGCITLLAPLGLMVRNSTVAGTSSRLEVAGMIFTFVFYALATTGLIWTGIASIRAHRWVRPIVLIFSTIWLCIGVLAFVMVAVAMTNLSGIISATRTGAATSMPVSSGAVMVGGIFAVAFSFFVYIAMPVAAILFYRPVDVQRTLEFYDPVQRWTDRCPLPVLGMSVGCAIFAGGMLLTGSYGMLFIFGVLLTGISVQLVMVPVAAILVVSAILIYKRRMLGWNLAAAVALITQGSMIVSAFFFDVQKMGTAMGATTQEMEIIRSSPTSQPIFMMLGSGILTIAGMIYAIRIRHYFRETKTVSTPTVT